VTQNDERQLEKDIRYYCERITFLYAKLLVHEKPKLSSVEFKGDQQRPVYCELDLELDLRRLPAEDPLRALARILPQLGGATGQGRDPGTARSLAPWPNSKINPKTRPSSASARGGLPARR
jgi:hypothetical protein